VIGFFEAQAIDRFVKEDRAPRPLTHDLLAGVVTALGSTVSRVEVTHLKEGTFHAVIHLDGPDGRHAEVDARPSDAIALATAAKAPIFVAEAVLEESATV